MNFVVICLHSLDMRDFYSELRHTPHLDQFREQCIFIQGRGQSHHQADSLNAELTGMWTARMSNSKLGPDGYTPGDTYRFPKTLPEYLQEYGYDLFTAIGFDSTNNLGSFAAEGAKRTWLKEQPERWKQFSEPTQQSVSELLHGVQKSKRFYLHVILRDTHRPWNRAKELFDLLRPKFLRPLHRKLWKARSWPHDAYCARRLALEQPSAFAALRRAALEDADRRVGEIIETTKYIENTTYLIYTNHGEMFDHYRYHLQYSASQVEGLEMIEGTSHGNFPYEALYTNMQMWRIHGQTPTVMQGVGRSIDITPTILELAGIESGPLDGGSQLPHFKDGMFPMRKRFAESPSGGGCLSMVREDQMKFLSTGACRQEGAPLGQRGFPSHQLAVFDLNADPCEQVNLINTSSGKQVLDWAIETHCGLNFCNGLQNEEILGGR